MKSFTKLCRVAAGVTLAMAMQAQAAEPARKADPADAHAAVPPTRYRSALPYRPAPVQEQTADQNWKSLNQTVGATNSMSLTMGGAHEPAQPDGQQAAVPMQHHHHHEMKQ